MAVIPGSRPAPFGAISALRTINWIETAATRLRHWNQRRATENALARLSDHELRDIGLTRGNLECDSRIMTDR